MPKTKAQILQPELTETKLGLKCRNRLKKTIAKERGLSCTNVLGVKQSMVFGTHN